MIIIPRWPTSTLSSQGRRCPGSCSTARSARGSRQGWWSTTALTSSPSCRQSRASSKRSRARPNWRPPPPPLHQRRPSAACPTCCPPTMDPLDHMLLWLMHRWKGTETWRHAWYVMVVLPWVTLNVTNYFVPSLRRSMLCSPLQQGASTQLTQPFLIQVSEVLDSGGVVGIMV